MEITVAEAVGQEAVFRMKVPEKGLEENDPLVDVRRYIKNGDIIPMPCPTETEVAVTMATKSKTLTISKKRKHNKKGECACTDCGKVFSQKLQKIADAINSGKLEKTNTDEKDGTKKICVADLEAILEKK
eukprot:2854862-Ditylum_brightwellii.AAC.1